MKRSTNLVSLKEAVAQKRHRHVTRRVANPHRSQIGKAKFLQDGPCTSPAPWAMQRKMLGVPLHEPFRIDRCFGRPACRCATSTSFADIVLLEPARIHQRLQHQIGPQPNSLTSSPSCELLKKSNEIKGKNDAVWKTYVRKEMNGNEVIQGRGRGRNTLKINLKPNKGPDCSRKPSSS